MTDPNTLTLRPQDLNVQGGIHCPSPKADMPLWSNHPRVFLDVARTGQARCPYCGTVYQLANAPLREHHS